MTPAARVQAAIDILSGMEKAAQPADAFIREWFRSRRYAGSKDRAAVTQRVYDVLRHRASFAWRVGPSPRGVVLASLLSEGKTAADIAALFSGGGYGPQSLNAEEQRALAATPRQPPRYVQGDYPEWLEPELARSFGDALDAEMQAMQSRAAVDLRVNTLRTNRDDLLAGLNALGIAARATPYSPWGVRIDAAEGLSALKHTEFFANGAFEFQDEASQIGAFLCGAQPGEHVLDLAAGAGGKSLALAAAMQNEGEILAFDDNSIRLKPLEARANRAGATIIKVADKRGTPVWGSGLFDCVLVDAPCSGSGTWRRNPELKWRLTADRLKTLHGVQAWLLEEGARHTKKGGRLIYATCSLLACENEDIIAAFLARYPNFQRQKPAEAWQSVGLEPPPDAGDYFRASPLKTATDGFFVCIMARA